MKGVSEVIAIILILMITISLAGLAYMFMSTTMSDVTSSAGSTVDTTTSSMLTSFAIESIDIAKVYVRNTGQNVLTSLSVYVNDESAIFNMTPTSIAAGAVGTVTIYSFIPDGAAIKIISPSGFSTSKVARPCEKAVGCWKFDETSGTTAYDSSSYGITGTLMNGANYTNGIYGSGLNLDGTNDFVMLPASSALDVETLTISALVYSPNYNRSQFIFEKTTNGQVNTQYSLFFEVNLLRFRTYNSSGSSNTLDLTLQNSGITNGGWFFISAVYDGNRKRIYVNGIEKASVSYSTTLRTNPAGTSIVGAYGSGTSYFFSGIIDEVRIYNRAIY